MDPSLASVTSLRHGVIVFRERRERGPSAAAGARWMGRLVAGILRSRCPCCLPPVRVVASATTKGGALHGRLGSLSNDEREEEDSHTPVSLQVRALPVFEGVIGEGGCW